MSEKISGMGGVILVETESGRELAKVKNTVTNLLEEYVAAQSLGFMYAGNSAIEAGQNFVFSPLCQTERGSNYQYLSNCLITVYLLNLSEAEKAALNKSSNLLPVYDSEFNIDSSKIVGYATATYTATEPKQGYLIPTTGTTLANPRRHGLKFQWDTGVLSGTYNAIAIGFNVTKYPTSGISIYRGLETNNQVLGENDSDGYMIKPGIKSADGSIVITGENEVLLGDSSSTLYGRKILNLVTGEITLLSSDDVRYGFPLVNGYFPQLCTGNYFVYSDGSTLYQVDLSTKSKSTAASTGYDCFIYNGYVYSRYSTTTYRAYALNTLTYTSSKNLTIAKMNFPPSFLESNKLYTYGISSIGDKYLLTYRYKYGSADNRAYAGMNSIIFSNPEDIKGSIIDFIPYLNTFNGSVVAGKKVFFNNVFPHSTTYANTYWYKNAAGTGEISFRKNGVKMTTEGLYGNLLSFKTFDTDQQIPTGEGLKLTYYYTFEQ